MPSRIRTGDGMPPVRDNMHSQPATHKNQLQDYQYAKGGEMDLADTTLFKGMKDDFITAAEKTLMREKHAKGDLLFKTGDPADSLYILEDGRISICADQNDHSVSFIHAPGDFFGWSSLLNRPAYSASAEAVLPTTVLRIKKDTLETIFKQDPAGGFLFIRNFANIVGGRFIDRSSAKDWFPSVST
jgi:CRP/FNR family transcriptional regulator, cyclic AMP receptor protein